MLPEETEFFNIPSILYYLLDGLLLNLLLFLGFSNISIPL